MARIIKIAHQNIERIKYIENINEQDAIHGKFYIPHLHIHSLPFADLKPYDIQEDKMDHGQNRENVVVRFKEIEFIGIKPVEIQHN
jgi:hypothetical protein